MLVVTGASGMIGRAVVAALRAAGKDVRLHGRAQLDLETAQQEAYDDLVRGCDAVVHCAALVHRPSAPADLYDRLNVRATRMLAIAAARQGVESFVFLSTLAVYGSGPFEQIRENAALGPGTPYAVSKVRGEDEVAAASAIGKRIILRPALTFGEGDRGNLLRLIRQIDKGLYFHIAGNTAAKSLIFAPDLAAIVQHCLERLPPGCHVLNAANAQPVGVTELANLIASSLGRSAPPSLPRALVEAGAALLEAFLRGKAPVGRDAVRNLLTTTTCSIERLASAGCSPVVPLAEALRAEIRWARGAGLLRAGA